MGERASAGGERGPERLLLQWLRTAMNLMGFGFLIARFGMLSLGGGADPYRIESGLIGIFLVLLSVVFCGIAVRRYVTTEYETRERPVAPVGLAIGTMLAGVGLLFMLVRMLLDAVS